MKRSPLKNLAHYLLMFCLVSAILSCSKDSDDPAPASSDGVAGSWKITAISVDPAQDGITDLLAFIEAFTGNKCISSSVFDFKANGTLDATVPAGCTDSTDGTGVPDDKSTWKVVGNKIQLTDGTDVTEYDLTVSKTEMKWSYTEVEDQMNYKVTFVFKKP